MSKFKYKLVDNGLMFKRFKVTFHDGRVSFVEAIDTTTARTAACLEVWLESGNWPTVISVEKA